jgi:hypothetical protein
MALIESTSVGLEDWGEEPNALGDGPQSGKRISVSNVEEQSSEMCTDGV